MLRRLNQFAATVFSANTIDIRISAMAMVIFYGTFQTSCDRMSFYPSTIMHIGMRTLQGVTND